MAWDIHFMVIWLSVQLIGAQLPIDCRFAPPAFQGLCLQLLQFDTLSRRNFELQQLQPPIIAPPVPGAPWLSPAVPQTSFTPSPHDCMDLQCLCPYFRGHLGAGGVCILPSGRPLQKAIRREYRVLTDDERLRYNRAIQQMKANGEYDRWSDIHRQVGAASGAHSGPAFLPWHREFIKRFEIALRLMDTSLAIPYWDSVMDSYLPDPRDSIMFSSLLVGDIDPAGNVVNGPYAGFRTLEGHPYISRRPGAEGRLFTERILNDVFSRTRVEDVLSYTAPQQGCPYPPNFGALEYTHGSVHIWVGGDMKPVITSANDPMFFLLHSFVDYIFEMWRQLRQNRWERENAFAPDIAQCESPQHFFNSQMKPFNMPNKQGLSNAYTDFLYSYAPRPACNAQTRSCGSQFLFCDLKNGPPHCVSKIKMNGLCRGFEGEDACYGGVCGNGYCRPGLPNVGPIAIPRPPQGPHPAARQPPFTRIIARQNRMFAAKTAVCFNDDPCCGLWAIKGECGNENSTEYMNNFCKRSCGFCKSKGSDREGCIDRHFSCPYFQSKGDCTKKPQWMAENCQLSCGLCKLDPEKLCFEVAVMSKM